MKKKIIQQNQLHNSFNNVSSCKTNETNMASPLGKFSIQIVLILYGILTINYLLIHKIILKKNLFNKINQIN